MNGQTSTARRFLRKHKTAAAACLIFHFIFFFPSLFMGRVVSPNDIFYEYEPWSAVRSIEPQNPLLAAPATAYITLISLLKSDPSSFHWNRFIASGVPGYGSAAAAVMSPFILLPGLLLPLTLVFSGVVLVKFNFAFWTSYLWLREERMGKAAAGIAAISFAAAGPFIVWWLAQQTNVTSLYPAALLCVVRAFHGKRNSLFLMTLLAVAFLLSGFPAMIAYAAWVVALYALFLAVRHRRIPIREMLKGSAALLLAAIIAAPFLSPFISFLQRTGYLELRSGMSTGHIYYPGHLLSFLNPYRLGTPTSHEWLGDSRLGVVNDFIEATVYAGLLTIFLAIPGMFRRRSRHRFFWIALLLFLVVILFFGGPLARLAGQLPGLKFSLLTRLRVLLPLPLAYLAASGAALVVRWVRMRGITMGTGRRWDPVSAVSLALAVLLATDLAIFAALYHPYLSPKIAEIPKTASVEFLRRQAAPFRMSSFFVDMVPNTSELLRLEDIRSHWSSEKTYRALIFEVDPKSWDQPTFLLLHPLSVDLTDPIFSMLNLRYFVESPKLDAFRPLIEKHTIPSGAANAEIALREGAPLELQIEMPGDGIHAIRLDPRIESVSPGAALQVRVLRPETGEILSSRRFDSDQLRTSSHLYVPLHGSSVSGDILLMLVSSTGVEGGLPAATNGGETSLQFHAVSFPWIPLRDYPEGRIFENMTALERFWGVWSTRQGEIDQVLRADFAREAIVSDSQAGVPEAIAAVPPARRRASIRIERYDGSDIRLRTRSEVPFLLASSEKLSPELRVDVDGKAVNAIRINGLFAGVPLAGGEHTIRFTRRIGRGWWVPSFIAMALVAAAGIFERGRGRVIER